MRVVRRLSSQKRVFELTKAIDKEAEELLNKEAEESAKHREDPRNKKWKYGR